MIKIEKGHLNILEPWLDMRLALWPDNDRGEFEKEIKEMCMSDKENAFLFSCDGAYAGFIEVSLRKDYVEGSDSSPVGYVEGIYVKPEYRGKGIARLLMKQAEEWAAEKGCTQMGSDAELHNTASQDFHNRIGFTEANRVVCYIKDIDSK